MRSCTFVAAIIMKHRHINAYVVSFIDYVHDNKFEGQVV